MLIIKILWLFTENEQSAIKPTGLKTQSLTVQKYILFVRAQFNTFKIHFHVYFTSQVNVNCEICYSPGPGTIAKWLRSSPWTPRFLNLAQNCVWLPYCIHMGATRSVKWAKQFVRHFCQTLAHWFQRLIELWSFQWRHDFCNRFQAFAETKARVVWTSICDLKSSLSPRSRSLHWVQRVHTCHGNETWLHRPKWIFFLSGLICTTSQKDIDRNKLMITHYGICSLMDRILGHCFGSQSIMENYWNTWLTRKLKVCKFLE